MEQSEVNAHLGELLKAHDLDISTEGDWLVPNNSLPAIRCIWSEDTENGTGRLDVHVLIGDGVMIEECFAGVGEGQTGFLDGLQNFAVNSFHVLLAAFWDKNDPEQVMTEQWEVGGDNYTAYVGNFGTRATEGIHPGVPEETFNIIEKAIQTAQIEDELCWIRTFFCNIGEERTYEALINNEVWSNGENALKSIEWPKSDAYYSVRNFLILRKNT